MQDKINRAIEEIGKVLLGKEEQIRLALSPETHQWRPIATTA